MKHRIFTAAVGAVLAILVASPAPAGASIRPVKGEHSRPVTVREKAAVNYAALCGPNALAPVTVGGRRFQIAFCEKDAAHLNREASFLGDCHRRALAGRHIPLARGCFRAILAFDGPRHALDASRR